MSVNGRYFGRVNFSKGLFEGSVDIEDFHSLTLSIHEIAWITQNND